MKMKTVINVKEREKAIKEVDVFRKKKYDNKDIRFSNTELKKLNEKMRVNLFNKNDIFISSETLWELMQEIGESGKMHNYHGLTPEDIVDALNSMIDPYAIFETKYARYAIVTTTITHFKEQLMVIIEVGSGVYLDVNANINKIITMYPKRNVDIMLNGLDKKDILFIVNNKK